MDLPANSAHDEFMAGSTYTDSVSVTSADGTVSGITVNILGTNDAAVITPAVDNLTESNVALTTGGTMVISDVDSATTFTALTAVAGSNSYGTFSMTTAGVDLHRQQCTESVCGRHHLHRCSECDQCRWHHQQHHGEHPGHQ
ncbi:MAG: hypothetical protein IPO38_08645 [Rhodocyclaceae bacterium]|nr:hypothetical protein [Rhodocyclaceae bacterium]